MTRELPLRITEDERGGLGVVCGCGAELAAVRGAQLEQDFSPAGLIRMILHAKRCTKGNADAGRNLPDVR